MAGGVLCAKSSSKDPDALSQQNKPVLTCGAGSHVEGHVARKRTLDLSLNRLGQEHLIAPFITKY